MKFKTLFLFFSLLVCSADDFKDLSTKEFNELVNSTDNLEELYFSYIDYLESNDSEVNSIVSLYSSSDLKFEYVNADQLGLNGVPILIKDNIDSVGLPNTAGSLALQNNLPRNDSQIVSKLKKAGLVVVGKANLSEWANFRGNPSSSGWSSFGGQTNNPYNLEYNPCGSSSGSAAAVAEGLVPLAIGTETNGSISCPASSNGVVGIKPTVGLVSRDGIIPISATQDTAGPMARSVLEAAQVLKAISGYDPKDSATKNIPDNYDYDALINLTNQSLENKNIGLLIKDEMSGVEVELLNKTQRILENLGANVQRVSFEVVSDYKFEDEYYLLLYEFQEGIEKYLKSSNSMRKSLNDLIDFNEENSEKVLKHFGHEIFLDSIQATDKERYIKSRDLVVTRARNQIDTLILENGLDALVGLTRNPVWKTDHINGDSRTSNEGLNFGNGGLSAVAGYPHITIPLDFVNGLPVGVSFLGRAWEEAKIINFAFSFEQENNFFPRPSRN